jgi:hypothetical protein
LLSLAIFLSQYAIVFLVFWAAQERVSIDAWFLLVPLRFLIFLPQPPTALLFLGMAYFMAAAWALAVLAFRRAADAGITHWIAVYAIVPFLQLPVILYLSTVPSRQTEAAPAESTELNEEHPRWVPAAQGVIAGFALTLIAVAVAALLFGTYGFGMFLVSPFVVGAMTGYFANRGADIDTIESSRIVMCATAIGALGLMAVALEGAVCIVLAAPIWIAAALVGGLLGRAIAEQGRSPAQTVSGLAALPLVFALETAFPVSIPFATEERIVIDAAPAAVWNAIVHMSPIDGPLTLPFRLGVAYPIGAEIIGEGIGAVRHGRFSTGTAIERVTEWEDQRKLAFAVLSEVPAMRELSPYEHVHAPHVVGYFRTTATSFALLPRGDGRTELIEQTSHELKLDPVFYWLPLARWLVHENNARVLAHIRRDAERGFKAEN